MKLFRYRMVALMATLLLTLYAADSFALTGRAASPGGSVTAVSDTTDNDDAEGTVLDTLYENPDNGRALPSWLKFPGWDAHDSGLFNLFGMSGIALTTLFIFFAIFLNLLPFLLILLVVWLIVRRHRNSRKAGACAPSATLQEKQYATMQQPDNPYERINKRKDAAIIHISLGIGMILFFIIIYVKLCIGIGCVLACYGIGEYINAKREERRNNDDNPS